MARREDQDRVLLNSGPRDKRTFERLFDDESDERKYDCTCGVKKGQGVCKACLKREADYYAGV